MARLKPFIDRQAGFREANLGKVIVFCEGCTEENYFKYFSDIIGRNQNKYTQMEIVAIRAGGNAQRVLNFANEFWNDDKNLRTFGLYDKYLVFDCDSPEDIQKVIQEMLSSDYDYTLLASNLLFETWLLMHLEIVNERRSKATTYTCLAIALGLEFYGDAEKASPGIIRQIIGNGDNLRVAIDNARDLEQRYKDRDLTIDKNLQDMNPYTTVHRLMELILAEMQRYDAL